MKPRNIAENTRFYRRGSIMGLTVAETFILLVFALLLLLLLLKNQAEEVEKELETIQDETQSWRDISSTPELSKTVDIILKMPLAEQQALSDFVTRDNLNERLDISKDFEKKILEMDPKTRDEFKNLMDSPDLPEFINRSDEITNFIQKSQDEVELIEQDAEKWRTLNSEPEIIRTISQLSEMPSNERRRLTEFMARNDLQERLNISNEFDNRLVEMDPEVRNRLIDMVDSKEFTSLINRRDEITKLLNSEYDLNQVIEQLNSNTLISTEVAKNINQRLGELVREFGGEIGSDKVISVPSDRSFSSGSATLTTEFKSFLSDFCPKFIHELNQYPHSVQDIRVEGHASSEWSTSSSIQDRYLKNLDLSQRRAYAVLSYCLEILGKGQLFDWAKQKITAVGFSSTRPILDKNLNEDKDRSRRVAFSYIVNYDQSNINSLVKEKN